MRSKLQEGMREGDLADLVLPMLSIDEYTSKISNKTVVTGFYVQDIDAANDLNRFIQKSPLNLLDTEVSPAPDQRGYYILFVEMMMDAHFGKRLKSLLDEVGPLCGITKWQAKVRHHKALLDFDPATVQKAIVKARGPLQEGAIAKFLSESELPTSRIHGDKLSIAGADFIIEAFGMNAASVYRERALETDFRPILAARRLVLALGERWNVDPIAGRFVITNITDTRSLVIRPLFP